MASLFKNLFNIMTSADNDSKFKKGQIVQATISQVTEEGLQVLLPFLKREIPVPKEELDCDEYNVYDYMSQIGEIIDLIVAELRPSLKLTQKALKDNEDKIMDSIIVKLKRADFLRKEEHEGELELIDAVDDGKVHKVKLTTNKLELEYDKRDNRNLNGIKRMKMVFKMSKGGCLILMGNLGCSFNRPFGGEFYVTKALMEEKTDFKAVEGVGLEIQFGNFPTEISLMQSCLARIAAEPKFVFNLSQFDEFMDIFGFYKTLSSELNNNVTYKVETISTPFYFVSVNEKDIEIDEANAITNLNGIVMGYKLEQYKYEQLKEELRDKVQEFVNIKVKGGEKEIKKIRSFADNLYLSNEDEISDYNVKQLCSFGLVNISEEEGFLILSGELKTTGSFKYLHLYDMGQKVKLESIDNSLRLIKQGETGAAAELLEYIIGSKTMPNKRIKRTQNDGKDSYLEGLDESQKQAFIMATDGSPVSLIKGPPGTGKTHVINAIVQYITKELHEKVVISSQTHVAIDNVLDKLMENYDLIIPNRITNRRNKYAGSAIDTTLYKTWAKKFSQHNLRSNNSALKKRLSDDMEKFNGENKFRFSENITPQEYSVLGATTTTSAIGGRKGLDLLDGYDWLIIDEVSKCPITEVLRYLPYVKKIIMVGDDFQLAPLLEFSKDEVKDLLSFNEDKFERLKALYEQSVFAKTLQKAQKVGRLVTLNVNYRSVKGVLNTYNIFYNNTLINRREIVKPSKVKFSEKFNIFNDRDVFFVDVKNGKEAKEGTSRYNIEELYATKEVLADLLENTVNPSIVSVSAIFPYAAQIDKFQKLNLELINQARKTFKSFEIDTVDAFQGRETDIVLVNTVVTDESQRNFLDDFRRINVSMSRARDKLFIFGNPTTLSQIDMKIPDGGKRRFFSDIIADIKRFGQVVVYNGGVKYDTGKSKIKID